MIITCLLSCKLTLLLIKLNLPQIIGSDFTTKIVFVTGTIKQGAKRLMINNDLLSLLYLSINDGLDI